MIRVMVMGMGPIGVACARAVAAERHMMLVGLVDNAPAKQGLSLDQLESASSSGSPASSGPRVVASLDQALASGPADLLMLTTTSRLDAVAPTLREALKHKLAVVSSCEEMSWPAYRHPVLAQELDKLAKEAGKALLGTGVNPGFVMDSLAVMTASVVRRVKSIRCTRRVNASLRRLPLQAKVGATMTVQEFKSLAEAGRIGHMGLAESVAMIATGLGHTVEPAGVQVTLEPVVATKAISSSLGLIEPGRVCGIQNNAHWHNPQLAIDMELTMAIGLEDPMDVIEIHGPVQVKLKIPGGLPGDSATVAVMLNYARIVHTAPPGLHTMLSLPIAGCQGADK